jgi:hypothetical protein
MNVFQLWFAKEWRALVEEPSLPFGADEHERRAAFVVWCETGSITEYETWYRLVWPFRLEQTELPESVWGTGPWSWDRRAAWMTYEAMWEAGSKPPTTEEQLTLF